MEALAAYGSDSSDNETNEPQTTKSEIAGNSTQLSLTRVNAAPDVPVSLEDQGFLITAGSRALSFNPTFEDMTKPVQGAENPHQRPIDRVKNAANGVVESYAMPNDVFEAQRKTFKKFGYAVNPDREFEHHQSSGYVGDVDKAVRYAGATVNDAVPEDVKLLKYNKKRLHKGDVFQAGNYLGPWAGYEGEEVTAEVIQPTEEDIQKAKVYVDDIIKMRQVQAETSYETSVFHGKRERDALGRTYMDVPHDVDIDLTRDPGDHECFAPKTLIHTWSGHAKGVNAIQFFPGSGHLLLSGSMDSRVKVWDVYHNRECLRTYIGHEKAVRDVCFSNDGRRFLSGSYDRYVKLWDTETGQCIQKFTKGSIPYCVKFHPEKQNEILAGCSDNKIIQWDANTGDMAQEYNQHLRAVNTITFIDENRRFVSTSDDKSIRVWEYGIPVTIKYIAEPHMHSMPSAASDPTNRYVAFQSMDNQVLIYNAEDKFRLHRKKRFAGHLVSGYACQLGFSPDGKYIMSGDAGGSLVVWDWSTGRIVRRIKAHSQVTLGCVWHPQEPSRVATCSWDGTIKYWD